MYVVDVCYLLMYVTEILSLFIMQKKTPTDPKSTLKSCVPTVNLFPKENSISSVSRSETKVAREVRKDKCFTKARILGLEMLLETLHRPSWLLFREDHVTNIKIIFKWLTFVESLSWALC